MPFAAWNCAHGEAAPVWLPVAEVVPLAPMDDSVDTNMVVIEGAGSILSFGDCQRHIMVRVMFTPLVMAGYVPPGGGGGQATIRLVNSLQLNLLSGQQRSISNVSYGMYLCDGDNKWNEVYFVQQGAAMVTQLEDRLAALETRLATLEAKT
jgi:hypothetical protein